MSLGCARCGDCCTNIQLSAAVAANLDKLRAGEPLPENSDPSYMFVLEHWLEEERQEDGTAIHSCDRLDAATMMCLAHEDRPPVCSGFPFYGNEVPTDEQIGKMHTRCSYALDIAPERRSEGARPLIPLMVVHNAESRPVADQRGGSGDAT